MLRGKQLDEVIEQELQMMLVEGFEKSPISHKALHNRLTFKRYISGGLSTLKKHGLFRSHICTGSNNTPGPGQKEAVFTAVDGWNSTKKTCTEDCAGHAGETGIGCEVGGLHRGERSGGERWSPRRHVPSTNAATIAAASCRLD